MNIEEQLGAALRRKPAPADLADRVLARIETRSSGSSGPPAGLKPRLYVDRGGPLSRARRALPGWLAAAAAVTFVVAGAARYTAERQAMAEAERARQEIRMALQITSEQLALVQQRLEKSTRDSGR